MNITGFSTGMTVQGSQSFGTLNTESEAQAATKAAGDNVEISDEAKQLYAQMQKSHKKPEDMSPEEMEAFLEEHPEAAAMQAEQGKGAQAAPAEGQKSSGGGGGKGGGESASASSSTDSTTTETSLEAEILALELQIEQAEKSGNSTQVEALEAELTALEDELDELTEA